MELCHQAPPHPTVRVLNLDCLIPLLMYGALRIDGDRQLAVTAYCLHTFFDDYLQDSPVSPPQISSQLYPEIQVLK
jgi:hypothetical protein